MRSKKDKAIVEAYKRGYRVVNGNIFYIKNRLVGWVNYYGYLQFGIRFKKNSEHCNILVHRFVAYQKYGSKIFDKKLQTRHLDGNKNNNKWHNIKLGTPQQNNMDKTPEARLRAAINASSFVKKHDHELIVKMHKNGMSYNDIMFELGIKSKGVISFIINKSIASCQE